MHPKRTFIGWKPLVWFVKGEPKKDYLPEYVPDIILSPKADKNLDQWEQSIVDAEHVIKYLTVENEVVCDPMMGREATTGKACLNLKRQFIGFEIDDNNYRLAEATLKDHSQKIREEEKELK
jgi:DNA methylase